MEFPSLLTGLAFKLHGNKRIKSNHARLMKMVSTSDDGFCLEIII